MTKTPIPVVVSVADDLYEQLRSLVADPQNLQVVNDPDGPEPWAVFLPVEPGPASFQDIIGAGESRSEALADAIETVRTWQ